ncbi:hypothetical protein L1987_08701 [Smallanthus sonchifolius]|uniref:Uncharacterized protein n=1 Tax=Smallanthus sonchifolius TaxID=185202 RepID=A0ACB9JLE2_9ASTR|nr:hypothetical protein L1987_08701 [Smallanthus sonchifolius]
MKFVVLSNSVGPSRPYAASRQPLIFPDHHSSNQNLVQALDNCKSPNGFTETSKRNANGVPANKTIKRHVSRLSISKLAGGTYNASKSFPTYSGYGDARMKVKVHHCRKLKENTNVDHYKGDTSNIDLLDYHQTDPVPSSKTSIKHGPIQHDVPLMPYIPKPPPPEPNDHLH